MRDGDQAAGSTDTQRSGGFNGRTSVVIVAAYAFFASLWIFASDTLLGWLVADPVWLSALGMLKGWLFVAVTSVLLWMALRRARSRAAPASPPAERPAQPMSRLLLGIVAVVVAIAALAVEFSQSLERRREAVRLETLADLRAGQITEWVIDLLRHGDFVRTSGVFADLYRRWHEGADPSAGPHLIGRLHHYAKTMGAQRALILDASLAVVLSEDGEPRAVPPELQAAGRRAFDTGQVQHTGIYRVDGAPVPVRFDLVVPLAGQPPHVRALAVLRTDPADDLFQMLRTWPLPSRTGESVLWRRDGDDIVALSDFRHEPGAAARLRRPLSGPVLGASHIRGDVPSRVTLEGRDYRGEPVLGVTRVVEGTDWHLVTKIDRAEVRANGLGNAAWIAGCAFLVLFTVALGAWALRERQALQFARREREQQAERLRTLALLAAVADSSPDAIYAKDRVGRYLLFNPSTALITGRTEAQMLGRDDREVFPPHEAAAIAANDARVMAEQRSVVCEETLSTARGVRTFMSIKGPLLDSDGQVIGMFGVSRDITERQRAEAELRESREVFRQLAEIGSDSFWALDTELRFTALSATVALRSGLELQRHAGRRYDEMP
ncbi:MAG TPA: PAS domain-containing protein, partial [Albitalea sp.]